MSEFTLNREVERTVTENASVTLMVEEKKSGRGLRVFMQGAANPYILNLRLNDQGKLVLKRHKFPNGDHVERGPTDRIRIIDE